MWCRWRSQSFHNFIFLLHRCRLFRWRLRCCRSFSHGTTESSRYFCGGWWAASRGVRIDENRHDIITRWDYSITVWIIVILFKARLSVIFLIQVQNRSFIFFAVDVTARLITAISTILKTIAIPLVRNAFFIRHTFEFIVVAEFTIDFIFTIGTVTNVIAS